MELDTPITYEQWMTALHQGKAKLVHNMRQYYKETGVDCHLFPTLKLPAQKLEDINAITDDWNHLGVDQSYLLLVISNIDSASVCNNPGLTMPVDFSPTTGCPIGMEIDALTGDDNTLLNVGAAIEKYVLKA